jgi:pilus assembly protein FimV
MVRKLSLMLVLTLGLVPLAVQALGLGDIQLNSALNQKFNAEIKLMSVGKGQIDDIKVAMASDNAFKRSGVDRTFLLTGLSFKPERKADGSPIIRVTSSEPIREPFLNFLIEVNWPKGRLIREYTVLLDPPVTLERKPAPIEAPAVTDTAEAPATIAPAEQPAPMVDSPYVSGTYEVTVKKNSSLWVIARKNKHSGVDQHRMMMSIYHENPSAFIRKNINRLKQGAILRIPSKEDALAIGLRAAQKEYKQHVEAWRAESEQAKQGSTPEPVAETATDIKPESEAVQTEEAETAQQEAPEAAEKPATEMEQEAKVEEQAEEAKVEEPAEEAKVEGQAEEAKVEGQAEEAKVEEPAEAAVDGELKIATARPEGEGEAGPGEDSDAEQTIARLKQELLIVEEEAASARSESEELSSRVEGLESQLQDLERILELKSEQLASMQAALAKSQEQQGILEESAKQPEEDMGAAGEQSAIVAEEPKPEPVVEELKPEPMVEELKPEPMVEELKPEPMVEESKPESVVKPITEDESKPAKVVVPPSEPSLLDEIMSSPTMLGIVMGVIIILLALIWLLLSRKRASASDFQESILLNTSDSDVVSTLDEANDIPTHTEETSFLSDFSPSDIDALQDETGEVDPLSEADVYIAYGRYQQAEELIRQAIEKEPERDILKYKLFEILYAVKNTDSFVALAEETAGTVAETSDRSSWQRVLSMGKSLSPEHQLFVNADEIDAEDDLFSLDDDLLEEELDESDFADLDATLSEADFSAKKVDTESAEAVETADTDVDAAKVNEEDLFEMSGDLDDTGLGIDDFETSLDDESINAALDELEGLGGPEDATVAQEDDTESEDDFMLSLSDLEDESEKTVLSLHASTGEALGQGQKAMDEGSSEDELLANELEDTVIDFSTADSATSDSQLDDPMKGMDLDESTNEGMQDEVGTKLDLARAYVEMGDPEGAVDILDEVLSEGNAEQQQEAQQIKDTLS